MTAEVAAPYAVLSALLCCGLLAACDASSATGSGCEGLADDCSHVVEVRGSHVHFSMRVPETWGIGYAREDAVCGSASYRFYELPDDGGRLRVEAVPTECDAASSSSSIGNGSHGTYRTIDDVPEPEDVGSVETLLGDAVVFTQEYYECTNSCERWHEPVAIITLDDPVDPDYPTLVVRAERVELSRSDLEELLGALEEPYPPPSPARS